MRLNLVLFKYIQFEFKNIALNTKYPTNKFVCWVFNFYNPIENKITARIVPIAGTTTVNAPNIG